jgi:hypothetical protein
LPGWIAPVSTPVLMSGLADPLLSPSGPIFGSAPLGWGVFGGVGVFSRAPGLGWLALSFAMIFLLLVWS